MKLRKIQQEFFIVVGIINEIGNRDVIDAVARVQENIRNTVLLEVRQNEAHKQTSIVVGVHLESVQKYVDQFVKTALAMVDGRNLPPEVPSPGIIDSVAVIPLLISNLPMATLMVNDIAKELQERYRIPIYFFGKNATDSQRADIRFYRRWTFRDFQENPSLKPDLGEAYRASPTGGILLGSRLYYLTFALFLESDELEMVQEFLKAYTDYTGLSEAERELKNHALQKLKMQKIHILQEVQTLATLIPQMDMIRILCKIRDYQKAPLYQVYDLFDKAFQRLGVELMGMQILGFIPMEVLVLSGRRYFKGKSLRLMDDLRFLTFALTHFRMDVVEPFDKDLQIIEWRINHLLTGEETVSIT